MEYIEGKDVFHRGLTHLFLIQSFSLHTGRLRNLQVANYMQLYENGTCEIHLTCSVENPNDHVSFRWHVSGNILLEEANFTIFWDPKTSSEQTYYCIAENPVSNLSFSFSVQSPCKGNSLSQVSPRALSSYGVWHVLMTYMIPKTVTQWEAAKDGGRRQTPSGALGLSLSSEVSPSSLPSPFIIPPPTHSEPKNKLLGKAELFPLLGPTRPNPVLSDKWDSYSQKSCPEPQSF